GRGREAAGPGRDARHLGQDGPQLAQGRRHAGRRGRRGRGARSANDPPDGRGGRARVRAPHEALPRGAGGMAVRRSRRRDHHARNAGGVRLARRAARAGDEPRRTDALRAHAGGRGAPLGGAHRGNGAAHARPRGRVREAGGRSGTLRSEMPDVLMPKLSDTMEEGKIIRWLKHRGDKVAIGDILAEVETDKANMEIEAFDEGVLTEIRTAEGDAAPVGGVIAVLGEASTDGQQRPAAEAKAKAPAPQAAKPERPEPERREPDEEEPEPERRERDEEEAAEVRREPAPRPKTPPPAAAGRPAESRVRASPLARRRAREAGVDLDGVEGTGPGGRIVERDVEAALAGGRQAD